MVVHPQYIVNGTGDRTGVVLSVEEFQRLIEALEDRLDADDLDQAVGSSPEMVGYDEVRRQLREQGKL